jgi:serine/threonine protein kinase HipA of HipAB toxin-antitoxin module
VIVGDDCLRRALQRSADLPTGNAVDESERAAFYAAQAVEITQSLPGSSAGGEQPKFLATLRRDSGGYLPVLVKFSAPMEQETGRRWADLLACEFHAHEVLAEAGLSNQGARLLDAGGRRFLEIPRFDRSGASERMGVVSLEALSAASAGLVRDWNAAAVELLRRGLVDDAAVATIRRLHAFGELIGNSDMHFGNLAFFLSETLPLQVTPSYDMLPMLWAPGAQGEIVARRFAPAPPLPSLLEPWREAAVMAEDFWERVTADSRVSNAFIAMAGEALDFVRQMRRHVG